MIIVVDENKSMQWYSFIFKTGEGKLTKRYFLCWDNDEAWEKASDHAFTCGWQVCRMC